MISRYTPFHPPLLTPHTSPPPPPSPTHTLAPSAQGKTEEEVREIMGQKEAQANAQILEMVGDIPDADAKPPENVLFVCKLNPATTGEDLEIIFSRFGAIISSEVIKDQKSGDSLQYAFIEFENEEDCTSAYFKMDNVLIDDRRIHVDFCQSLAKVKGVRRKRLSSEKESLGDRFAPKSRRKSDGYEMVFDEVGSEASKPKKRRWDREEGKRSEAGLGKRGGGRDGREREDGRRKEESRRARDRERKVEDEGRERGKKHRHARSRSHSRERERHHHKNSRHHSKDKHR